jgi:probable FeS assembly SUF system protein SufT
VTSAETITVRRDCPAVTVPYGEAVTLAAGTEVRMVQALGGSITVSGGFGVLYRIDGADADAIGLEPMAPIAAEGDDRPFEPALVEIALRTVYDPEISVNVVDLGLIYRCEEIIRADGARLISIDMTMTSPGCGMGDVLREDARRAVLAVPGVDDVDITVVLDPPWSMDRMPLDVRLELGLL